MRAQEFIKATPSTEIYLDMDGVLADFFAGYRRVNPSVKSPEAIPKAGEDPTLAKLVGTDFYYRLPKYNTADLLVNTVLKYVDHYNICSSPLRGDYENSERWKRKWIAMYLSPKPRDILITHTKHHHAVNADGSPNILIDDKPSNISRWNAAGGIGILYDAAHNHPSMIDQALGKVF
jgi:hypothetical protein